jgi:hypothetical protein
MSTCDDYAHGADRSRSGTKRLRQPCPAGARRWPR